MENPLISGESIKQVGQRKSGRLHQIHHTCARCRVLRHLGVSYNMPLLVQYCPTVFDPDVCFSLLKRYLRTFITVDKTIPRTYLRRTKFINGFGGVQVSGISTPA